MGGSAIAVRREQVEHFRPIAREILQVLVSKNSIYVNHSEGWHTTKHGCEVRFLMPFDLHGTISDIAVEEFWRTVQVPREDEA